MRSAIFVVLLMLMGMEAASAAGPVKAFMHGNDLYPACRTTPDTGCVVFVVGLADALEMVAPHLTNICRPNGVTYDQLLDVFMNWLEDHPADRHRPAAKLAGLAFAEAWPCNK
jgi:hypothetical protein